LAENSVLDDFFTSKDKSFKRQSLTMAAFEDLLPKKDEM